MLFKELDDFDTYFSKQRNKYRPQSYCMDCQPTEARRRANEYYEKNREEKKQYAKDYRRKPENREKLKEHSRNFKIKYRDELKDCYVRDRLHQENEVPTDISRAQPELVETKRLQIQINRKIKELRNGKK